MASSLISLLFTLSSHVGFILVSWLIDAEASFSIALVFFAAFIYLFIMFRQCYAANANILPKRYYWSLWLCFYPFKQCAKYLCACIYCCFCCNNCSKDSKTYKWPFFRRAINDVKLNDILTVQSKDGNFKKNGNTKDGFNTRTFCIVFMWGWVLVSIVAAIIVAFYVLPIPAIHLFSNLLSTFQVLVLLLSIAISYKILNKGKRCISK